MITYCLPEDMEARRGEVVTMLNHGELVKELVESESGPYEIHRGGRLVFTAPHEVDQIRKGEVKVAERGTGNFAMALAAITGSSALVTTGTQAGDPNWDHAHPFRVQAIEMGRGGGIIDLHMMRSRGFEVCLGLGPRYESARGLWEPLLEELLAADVRVSLNSPFGGRGRTITGSAQEAGVPAIQIEMSFEVFNPEEDAHVAVLSAIGRVSKLWAEAAFRG